MFCWYIIILIGSVYSLPASLLEKIIGNTQYNEDDNSLTNYSGDFPNLDIYFKGNLINNTRKQNYTKEIIPFSTEYSDTNGTMLAENSTATTISAQSPISSPTTIIEPFYETNRTVVNVTLDLPLLPAPTNIDPVSQTNKNKINDTRQTRQGSRNSVEITEENASQEEGSSEEEGDGNMLTGLLSAFLSGLSRPDGSIDLEAIIGLLGSLSTQNPDGTYDFNGLTEILRSFLGGGGDGGGSDIGSFVAGLLGAVIRGVANPPGPKGAGILTGKIVTGILPALSGPPPPDNDMMKPATNPPLDSGSFITSFVQTALGSGGNGTTNGGNEAKYTLFRLIFSAVTGVFSAASSLSSSPKSDWN